MPMSPTLLVPRDDVPWNPSRWSSSQLIHWYHGGVPDAGLASTIQGGVGNTTTGWNDASGNARHCATINATPNVLASGSLEGINFAVADTESIQGSFNAPSDQSGTYWLLFRLLTGDNENTTRTICNWSASGSGTRNLNFRLLHSGGETTPSVFAQNGGTTASADLTVSAGLIVPNTAYSLVFEANGTANTYRIWLNETEITPGTTSGTQGYWLADINAGSQLNRWNIGFAFNGSIYENGGRRDVLGSDEANLLAHLTRQRAAAG